MVPVHVEPGKSTTSILLYILFGARDLNFWDQPPLLKILPMSKKISPIERLDLENAVSLNAVKERTLKIKEPFAWELRKRR